MGYRPNRKRQAGEAFLKVVAWRSQRLCGLRVVWGAPAAKLLRSRLQMLAESFVNRLFLQNETRQEAWDEDER